MKKYFELCDKLEFDNHEWKSYFFSEVSALAYHDGTRVKREILRLGFKNYKFIDNDGAQCHIFHNSEHIVIAFRGTEPTQFSDVKADLLAFKRKSNLVTLSHIGIIVDRTH